MSGSESGNENQSPVDQAIKRKFGEHLSLPRKVIKLDGTRNVSPSMCIKSSSIAGLSPLLKRTKSSDLHKLSPANEDKTENFSILKKPRLIHHQTKKSELRPIRLITPSSLSHSNETVANGDRSQAATSLPSSSLGSNLNSKLDNRFGLRPLSKPR